MQNLSRLIYLLPFLLFISTIANSTPYSFTASVTENSLYYSGINGTTAPLALGETVTGWFDDTIIYDYAIEDEPGRWGGAYINFYIDFGSFTAETPGGVTEILVTDTYDSDYLKFNDSTPLLTDSPSDFYIDEIWWTFQDSTATAMDGATAPTHVDPFAFDLITFGIESVLPGDGWNGMVFFEINPTTTVVPVPEPSTLLLLGIGIIPMFFATNKIAYTC